MNEEYQLLISQLPDDRLDLNQVFVLDPGAEGAVRPAVEGSTPEEPMYLQPITWDAEDTADTMKEKGKKVVLKRLILVQIAQLEPYELDLSQVYIIDGEARRMYKAEVMGDPADLPDPVLRVLGDRVVVQDVATAPTPTQLSDAEALRAANEEPEKYMGRIEATREELEAMQQFFRQRASMEQAAGGAPPPEQ